MPSLPASEPPGVSIVVPVYNSADTLSPLVAGFSAAMDSTGRPYEVILVDDGSTDASWETIVALSRADPRIRGLSLMRNYGQHNALLAGIRAARQPVTVTLDADLQHPPEAIPDLIEELDRGHDVVYGTPLHPQHGWWRNLITHQVRLALRSAMGIEIANYVSAFRAFRTELRDGFAGFSGPYVVVDVLLSWSTTRFGVVKITHAARREGRSSYSFRKLVVLTLTIVTAFSTRPLRIASLVGFTFTLLGFALLLFVVGRYVIEGESVPGFPFLASVIALFSGAQLFTLGLIGEYLARMHTRVMEQPSYAVRSEVAGPHAARD